MSLTALLVHDITIVTPGDDESRYGDTLKDWDNATRDIVKGWVSQASATEVLGEREAQVSGWRLFLHPDATIAAADRIEWHGITFEVDGAPNHAWTPRGEHHIEASLRVVEG